MLSYENDVVIEACLRYFERELHPNANELRTSDDLLRNEARGTKGPLNMVTLRRQLSEYFARDIDWADHFRFGDLSISAQRVALMLRALVKKPDLVILDEAFSGMDAFSRDKCMLFLAHGVRYFLDIRDGVARAEKTILVLEDEHIGHKTTVSGLEARQALICVSHVEEEVPSLVTDWLCLPEPNEGSPARFGHIDRSEQGKEWWDKVWGIKGRK